MILPLNARALVAIHGGAVAEIASRPQPTSIHKTSTGMRCQAEGPAIRFAQPLRGTAP